MAEMARPQGVNATQLFQVAPSFREGLPHWSRHQFDALLPISVSGTAGRTEEAEDRSRKSRHLQAVRFISNSLARHNQR